MSEDKKSNGIITKATLIPIGLVISLFGVAIWGGAVYEKVKRLEKDIVPTADGLQDVKTRLTSVEIKLGTVNDSLSDIKLDLKEIKNTR